MRETGAWFEFLSHATLDVFYNERAQCPVVDSIEKSCVSESIVDKSW